MIKLNKFNVTDGTHKARVSYSRSKLTSDPRECVTLYAKDYINDLHKIFAAGYINDTDGMSDYFEQGKVRIFSDNPLFARACEVAA